MLDMAFELYRKNAVTLWTITALVIVPLKVLEVIISRVSLPGDVFVHNGTLYTHTGSATDVAGPLAIVVLSLLGVQLATGAVFHLLLDSYLGRTDEVGESFALAWERIWSLIWLAILYAVLLAVGFVLLIIPGIWLVVAMSVAVPALMFEGVRGFGAIRRSMGLVSGRWWATLGRILLALILYIVAVIVIGVIAGAIAHGVSSVTTFEIIRGIVSAFVFILLAPFWAAVFSVIYIDLRVRKEGVDAGTLAAHPGESRGMAPASGSGAFESEPGTGPPPPTPESPGRAR
jgi:hypothetical protein